MTKTDVGRKLVKEWWGLSSTRLPAEERPIPSIIPVTDWLRRDVLEEAIKYHTGRGAVLTEHGDYDAAVRYGVDPDPGLSLVINIVLTLFTMGLWAIVWILSDARAKSREYTLRLRVDECGNVERTKHAR